MYSVHVPLRVGSGSGSTVIRQILNPGSLPMSGRDPGFVEQPSGDHSRHDGEEREKNEGIFRIVGLKRCRGITITEAIIGSITEQEVM